MLSEDIALKRILSTENMPIKLYMTETSPPVLSVLLTEAALGLQFEKKILDLLKDEHKTPAFLKVINFL